MSELAMLIPSRGRPQAVERMAQAWDETDGRGEADCVWLIDADDPAFPKYQVELGKRPWMRVAVQDRWTPMVPKLNLAARLAAGEYPTLGFMGDDHLPRSTGWAAVIRGYSAATDPAIIYGRDGYQDRRLPTWWAMSSSIVSALGRMVPAEVQHMYCDNAVMRLGEATGTLHYLPHVFIEHMHPVAGKAVMDEGYLRVNRRQQYARDQALYRTWLADGLERDAMLLRELRGV